MTHTTAIITLIVGLLSIVAVVGGFGIGLLRRWWSLEQWIKTSMEQDKKFKKSDRKLKQDLTRLVEQKLADHIEFDARLARMEREIRALRKGKARGELHRQEQRNRAGGRHARTT